MEELSIAEKIIFVAVINLLAIGILLASPRNKRERRRNRKALIIFLLFELVIAVTLSLRHFFSP